MSRKNEISSFSNSVFTALVEQSIAGIYIIQDDCFRYVNPTFARIFGYQSPAEITENSKMIDLVAPECRDTVLENIKRRVDGLDETSHYFFTGIRKDGKKIEVEVHGNRAILEGHLVISGLLLDVTEKVKMQAAIQNRDLELEQLVKIRTSDLNQALRKVQESEDRYRVMFGNSKIPMLLVDPEDGAIVDANEAASKFYGYPLQKLTTLRASDINQLSEDEILAELDKVMMQKHHHFFFVHKLADGSLRDVEVHSEPLEIAGKKLLYSIVHDITERRVAEAQLEQMNRDFITLLENTSDFVYFKDKESRFRFCSQILAQITGHSSWKDMVGKHDLEVFPEDIAKIYYEEEFPVFNDGIPLLNKTNPYYNAKGEKGWVNTNKWPVFDDKGEKVIGLFGIGRDVTDQHNAAEELRIAASVFNNASDGILITNAENEIIQVNQAFCRISGYTREEIIGKTPALLKSGHHDDQFYQDMWKVLDDTGCWQGEIWNRHKNGSLFACRTSINAITDADGNVTRYISLHSDITDFLLYHEEIEHMAYFDTLTELPNRVLLSDRMTQAMGVAGRSHTTIAVCFLDLDSFKPVNDQFGHKAGDLLLIEIAKRLKDCLRVGDTVARLGGDEFALLLTQLHSEEELLGVIERMLATIATPFTVPQGERVSVSASIGICLYPQYDVTGDILLKYADLAMYEAKEMGRNQYRIYGGVAAFCTDEGQNLDDQS